jgi:hypothetical protein
LDKHLHIISFDVPYPADYGGVCDLFYKLPALKAEGIGIHLHCFDNGRGEQTELNKYCEEVNYYKRNTGHKGVSTKLPYIVCSRKNTLLENNLLKDEFPILMEGVHCTALVLDKRFSTRKKFVRIHNVEYKYYKQLFHFAHTLFRKVYYWRESQLLKKYEKQLVNNATTFLTVTGKDKLDYENELGCTSVGYLPLFLPPWQVECKTGMGAFCLYHGKLSVDENEYAARWLLTRIFNKTETPLVIAGKDPSASLQKLAGTQMNACIVANPSEAQMQDLIAKAQVHVLPSFNTTGIKIKLLNALYNGRHCLVNPAMVSGMELNELCHVADGKTAFREKVEQLYQQPFTTADVEARKVILNRHYNNAACAKQLVKWIWET